jgi:type III restriction enzyme
VAQHLARDRVVRPQLVVGEPVPLKIDPAKVALHADVAPPGQIAADWSQLVTIDLENCPKNSAAKAGVQGRTARI